MVVAAVYARISLDELGLEKGVQRQLEDARSLAEARGWQLEAEYVDNDISASSGVRRPSYQRLLADAETGRFERIICWQTSRLWRNRVERAQAITRLGQLRIGIVTCKGPELDLASAYGRGLASLVTEFDSMESEIKSERQVRANQQKAEEGKAAAFVLYGWKRIRETDSSGRIVGFHDVENEPEANVVREITQRILTGESLRAILIDLNERKVSPPRGKGGWTYSGLKNVVLRPANVALRVHHGDVIGPAAWPAILARDDFDRVTALLKAPDRSQHRDGGRRHLLSFGVGLCGVCGGRLSARTEGSRRDRTGPRVPIYRCEKGCVQRRQDRVDELVGAVVVQRLSLPDAAGVFDSHDSVAAEAREKAEAVRARLDSAADQYAEGTIDAQQLARITARLRPDLEAAEAEARRRRPMAVPAAVDELHGERAAEVWETLPVTAKRAVMQALGLSVAILPRKKSGPGFDPDEIEFRWNT